MSRTQGRAANMPHAYERIRQVAERDKEGKFTALYHHVYHLDHLRDAYMGLKQRAAPGVDGMTWAQYGKDLEANLANLSDRLRRKAYRAKPVRRVHLPKPDGSQRPLGITALEDKIVQAVATKMLNAIYEPVFLGFSYGFRPGRSQHHALDAIHVGLTRKKVNVVLDVDVRAFFDSLSHGWLVKFIEHRIADQHFVRLIQKWLKAGVLKDGEWTRQEQGSPQGAGVSPILANVYLHYVLDLWVHAWRKRQARGEVIVVRYADDAVLGFQYLADAERLQKDLAERLARFDLELHPEKTRLIEFGRYAERNRERRGQGKPETFNFLGFTHISGKTRTGRFTVRRKTMRKKMRAKLVELKEELRRRMHAPVPEVGKWLALVLRGHYQYYGVPMNGPGLSAFRYAVVRLWHKALRRRSQRGRTTWARMLCLARRWLPNPRIYHPWPSERLCVNT